MNQFSAPRLQTDLLLQASFHPCDVGHSWNFWNRRGFKYNYPKPQGPIWKSPYWEQKKVCLVISLRPKCKTADSFRETNLVILRRQAGARFVCPYMVMWKLDWHAHDSSICDRRKTWKCFCTNQHQVTNHFILCDWDKN